MKKLIKELIETVGEQYAKWKWNVQAHWTASQIYNQAEQIDQIQKYYYYFTEDAEDRLSDVFQRVKNPKNKLEKLLEEPNILRSLYLDCFCSMNEPPNTLLWGGIEELIIVYCNEILENKEEEEI